MDLQSCWMTGVASLESQSQSCSEGSRSLATSAIPRLTSSLGQAVDVQMTVVHCDKVVATAALHPNSPVPMDVEAGQLVPIDMATPRSGRMAHQQNV